MTLHSVVDPATEDVVAEVESLDVAQVDAAVARAVAAGPAWRAVAPADRSRLLRRFAAAVDAHVDELADLEVPAPVTRSATPGGRPATSATCSTTTPRHRSGCSAGRSRSRAGST